MGASLVVIWFHESNGIDGPLIQVLGFILWRVETHFLEPFRDPDYNWFRVLKPKQSNGLRICKFQKVYLGMGKVIRLFIGSRGPFISFDPPFQKLRHVSLIKTLVFDLCLKWCFRRWDKRDKGIRSYNVMPWVQWNRRFLDPSIPFKIMLSHDAITKEVDETI